MKKIFTLLIFVGLVFGVYKLYLMNKPQIKKVTSEVEKYVNPQKISGKITINQTSYDIEIADTDDKRTAGLSNRTNLAQNNGMLFVYESKDTWAFWMKDMQFPLDFVWIDDEEVVDITENVPIPMTATYLPVYKPKQPVNYILEVNAGTIKQNNIKIGDTVKIILPTPEPYL